MATATKQSISFPPQVFKRLHSRRGDSVGLSEQIRRDLMLYWEVCRLGFNEAQKKITETECDCIRAVMQNTQWDASVIGVMLRGGIAASIEGNPKQCDDYNIDRDKLVEKLNSLTLFEHLGLLDWCRHGDQAPQP